MVTISNLRSDACWARTIAALSGARISLSASGSQLLYHVLRDARGCDLTMTREQLVVDFGFGATSRRAPEIVAELASWLTRRLKSRAGVIGGGRVPSIKGFVAWTFGPRAVWIHETDATITIQVRTWSREPPIPFTSRSYELARVDSSSQRSSSATLAVASAMLVSAAP